MPRRPCRCSSFVGVVLVAALSVSGPLAAEIGETADQYSLVDRARGVLRRSPLARQGIRPIRLTLAECLRLALRHNGKVRAGDYGIDAAEAQLSEAYAAGWPIFDYEYQTAPVPRDVNDAVRSMFRGDLAWHSRGKVAIGIPLYAFGKLRLAKELARQGIAAAREQQAQEATAVVAKVRQTYYGIQLAEEIARLLTDAIDRLQEKIAERQEPMEMATEGESSDQRTSPIDRLRLQAFRAELEKRLAETRMKEELAIEALRVQCGLQSGAAVTIASTRLQPVRHRLQPLAVYQQAVLAKRPEALLVATGVHAKRLQYELERRKPLPDVGVGGFFELGRTIPQVRGVTTTDDFTNPFNYTRAGLGVQVKGRFDPHGQRARVAKVRSEYLKASLEQGMAKEGLQLEVREAYLKAHYAKTQVARSQETERTARQLLFLTKSNFDLGIGEKQEYADALQLTLLTRSQYYEAVFNYNVAVAELEQKVGLTPEIPEMNDERK